MSWTVVRAELPLGPLEAFRLASFGIEYVPQYIEIHLDRRAWASRWFSTQTPSLRFLGVVRG